MKTCTLRSCERTRYRGLQQIVRFNWPFYLAGSSALLSAAAATVLLPLPRWAMILIMVGSIVAGFWLLASLIVSHVVYDRSGLCTWTWVPQLFDALPSRWVNIHAGFDESTRQLRSLLPGTSGRVFDIYDEADMTEPSIRRARQASAGPPSEWVDYRQLPLPDGQLDASFCLLSAHELRSDAARVALFRELHRSLHVDGRVIVAEHLRDAANFCAFGPGFLHFHSRSTWGRAAAGAGLELERHFRITPFITVFLFRRTS